MVFKWREGTRFSADPQKVGERLMAIRSANGGKLTAEVVVTEAEKSGSVLHPLFEWNDEEAAAAYRLHQARLVVNHLRVISPTQEETHAFIAVKQKPTAERAYEPVNVVLTHANLREQLLDEALRDLASWRRRYGALDELHPFIELMDEQLSLMDVSGFMPVEQ